MVESYTMLPTFSCLPQIKTLCSNHCMHNFHTKFVKIFEICKPHSQNLNKTLSPEQCSLLCFELALGRIFFVDFTRRYCDVTSILSCRL